MTGAIAASWLGEVVHNALSLPAAVLLGPETLGPGAISVLLTVAYARRPQSRIVQAALLGWGLLNLVGGGVLSVLPIELFPFVPDQCVCHYPAHALYALAHRSSGAASARSGQVASAAPWRERCGVSSAINQWPRGRLGFSAARLMSIPGPCSPSQRTMPPARP